MAVDLLYVADDYGVPWRAIGDWIKYDLAGKDWSLAGFAGWCAKWIETRDALQQKRETHVCDHCSLPLAPHRSWWLCVHCGLAQMH